MVTPQKAITMNIKSNTGSNSVDASTHLLKNKWNLWGHLPQENDWSVNSYKLVSKFKTVEDVIAIARQRQTH